MQDADFSAFYEINSRVEQLLGSFSSHDERALLCLVMSNIWLRLDLLDKGDIYEVLTRSQDIAKVMAEITKRECKISDIVISHSTS